MCSAHAKGGRRQARPLGSSMPSGGKMSKSFKCLPGRWDSKRQRHSKEEGEGCVAESQEGFPEEVVTSLRDVLRGNDKEV